MSNVKSVRPAFQAVELDPIDARLDAKAIEMGIPTLISPKPEVHVVQEVTHAPADAPAPSKPSTSLPQNATPRSRMKSAKIELPDYLWVELKKKAAEDMTSLRYLIMTALREKGFHISDADMIEDGRRRRD
jgi:hypothetical protein